MLKNFLKIITLSLSITLILSAQEEPQKENLTYNQIFKFQGPRLTKSLPDIKGWYDDKHFLIEKPFGESKSKSLIKVNAENDQEVLLVDYAKVNENLPDGFKVESAKDKTADNKFYLLEKNNNLYHYSIDENLFTQLTIDSEERVNATLSPNGKFAAFTKQDRNLYVFDVDAKKEIQITFDASETVYNGYASWVYYEEILGRSSRYKAFWWSPDSKQLAFMKFDDSPVPIYMLYNPDGKHGEWEKEHYPKAGDPLPFVWFGVFNLSNQKTAWADFDSKADHMIAWPYWHPNSNQLMLQWIPRSFDELKLYLIDASDGSKKEIYHEKQNSWVDWFEDIYVFQDESGFLVRSDKDGWRHLYYQDWDGNQINKITSGNWDVNEIEHVDETNNKVYFLAGKESSLESQLYSAKLDGSDFTKITNEPGVHRCEVSTNGSFIIDRFSNTNTPTKINLLNSAGEVVKELGNSKSEVMDNYNLGRVELFSIPTDDGLKLPIKWYLPPDFDRTKKYPIIFSVYGGPGSASVKNSWGRFTSPYWYAQHGIIYASVDNRASGHFGKEIMAQAHRKLGVVEIDDFITAAKWATEQPFIDSNKIAVSGGSYGGYSVLMCMTRGADYFDFGIADASVTDWLLYDNVYTERFMDHPNENPQGYIDGAVNTYADKYKGYVLITHGTMDDNVHPQNSLQVIDKFQDLDKDFEMIFYPKARHGVGFPKFYFDMRKTVEFWFEHLLERKLNPEVD